MFDLSVAKNIHNLLQKRLDAEFRVPRALPALGIPRDFSLAKPVAHRRHSVRSFFNRLVAYGGILTPAAGKFERIRARHKLFKY